MLNVTDRAREALFQKKLSKNIEERNVGWRLASGTAGELGLVADREQKGDQVVEHEGSTVLLIGKDLSDLLAGAAIDFMTTPEGPRLVLTRSRGKPR